MTTTPNSTEIAILRETVRRFVDDEVIPIESELIGDAGLPRLRQLMEKAKANGLWALGHPEEIGGGGLPFMDYVMINEIIGRSEPAVIALGTHTLQDSLMLHEFGTEEQKERFLRPLVDGEAYPAVGLTEPEVAGSDPTLMQTRAVLDGDEWVIDGHKWFTTWADKAAFVTVFAKTDPDAPSHQQFSAFLVPTDTPGYTMERVIPTLGGDVHSHCEIRLEGARVPADYLLGERGEGFRIAQRRLGPGRIFHCMRWLGQAQRAFDLMCDWANVRYAHGSVLGEKGEIQRYIAESAAEIQAHRLMTLDAARRIDQGDEARVEISLIKFYGARMLHNVIDRAIQVHGAAGVSGDLPLERMYRNARYARLYDGPDEVHRMLVARTILRDPNRAPWASSTSKH
jgi:alkylation response protein AidB-like acyl-CoA dehydrogenase